MVRWLLPREDVFYNLIEQLTVLLEKTATEMVKFADGAPNQAVLDEVRRLENEADKLVYESEEQFARVFVTPIDREDIQVLIVSIDDIIDLLYLTARTFVIYKVERPTPPMAALMRLLAEAGTVLRTEMVALRKHEYDKLIAAGRTLRELEKKGDGVFRDAVADLFNNPAIDAKILVRDKELLEDLENALDKFEMVAERLKNLAVKNG